MAKDVITRFKLETTAFDSKIKQASKELSDYSKTATKAKEGFNEFTKSNVDAARALGTMATSSTNAKQKTQELVGAFNEAAKAYNALTKEQQQSDFGKAMAQSLTQLQQRIRETKQELQGMGDTMKNSGLFGGGKLDGMLQVFGGNLMTKAAGFAASFASEIGSCVQQGIELARQGEGIRNAFERLGRGDILDGLREATHGTVTDLELMKAAVKFNDFKLPVEELGTMLAFAQQKAKDTGQSVDYMVDSIVTGLGRKSLMILDNLGLSAAEIKEKMKQTGDMTKAVGAIIREQMAKAGDYVETAADRATKADVELKNAMEELGRTFQPLTDAGTSMWTALETGALKFLSSVGSVIAQLTEAGRIAKQYGNMGGSEKVGNMLNYLKTIKTDKYRQGTYKLQVGKFDERINSYQQYLDDYKAWNDKKSIAAYDRMKAFQQRTGLSMYSDVKEQMGVYQRMRAEYIQGASGILNPTKPITTTEDPKKTKTKAELDELQKIQKKIADLTKEAYTADDDRISAIQKEIAGLQEQEKKLIAIKELVTGTAKGPDLEKLFPDSSAQNYKTSYSGSAQSKIDAATVDMAMGPLNIDSVNAYIATMKSALKDADLGSDLYNSLTEKLNDASTMTAVLQQAIASGVQGVDLTSAADEMKRKLLEGDINEDAWQEFIDKLNEKIENEDLKLVFDVDSKSIETVAKQQQKDAKAMAKDWQAAGTAIQAVGNAMQQIEDPAAKVLGTIAQAVATMALSYAQAAASPAVTSTGWGWIAFAATGVATMLSSIAAIKNATHFAQGGIVGGSDYTDNTPIMVSSGELILNKAQQSNLASQLEGGGLQNLNLETYIDGRDLVFVLNNDSTARGNGTLVRTRTRHS